MHYSIANPRSATSAPITTKELANNRCFTTLQARRSLHERLCDKALVIAKQDWATHIGDHRAHLFPATENKTCGNWIALVMPDAIPFRLGLMTYAANMVMLHSDITSGATTLHAEQDLNKQFISGLEAALPSVESTHRPNFSSRLNSAITNILEPFAAALLSSDHAIGTEVLHAWRTHYLNLSKLPSAEEIPTLESYITRHTLTLGTQAWLTTLRYALGISLTPTELATLQPALEAAQRSVTLTTDYHTWSSQRESVSNNSRTHNAVAVAMAEKGDTELAAMERVKALAIGAEGEFTRCKNAVKAEKGGEVQLYLDAVERFVAGNSLWCARCPRFHGY